MILFISRISLIVRVSNEQGNIWYVINKLAHPNACLVQCCMKLHGRCFVKETVIHRKNTLLLVKKSCSFSLIKMQSQIANADESEIFWNSHLDILVFHCPMLWLSKKEEGEFYLKRINFSRVPIKEELGYFFSKVLLHKKIKIVLTWKFWAIKRRTAIYWLIMRSFP